MELVNISLISIGLAADACAVSLSSGFVIRNIKLNKAIKIALAFGIFQGIMPLIGWMTGLTFRESIIQIDHWIAFALLAIIGGKMIYEACQDEIETKFNPLDNFTLLGLAIATSIDALAVGLSLSVLKTSIFFAAATIGTITFFLSLISVYLGHRWGDLCDFKLELIGGIMLVFIGGKILHDHLAI
ncbi:MAG: manganese efflux pump MntP family protein [Cyanobacteria bacterium P01_A01_bin.40]